jgi:hypothetical protein
VQCCHFWQKALSPRGRASQQLDSWHIFPSRGEQSLRYFGERRSSLSGFNNHRTSTPSRPGRKAGGPWRVRPSPRT